MRSVASSSSSVKVELGWKLSRIWWCSSRSAAEDSIILRWSRDLHCFQLICIGRQFCAVLLLLLKFVTHFSIFFILHSTILFYAVVHSRKTKILYLYVLLYPKHRQCKGFPISSFAIVVIIVIIAIFVIMVSNQSGCTPLNDHHQLFQRQLNFWNWAQQDPHSPLSQEEPFSYNCKQAKNDKLAQAYFLPRKNWHTKTP